LWHIKLAIGIINAIGSGSTQSFALVWSDLLWFGLGRVWERFSDCNILATTNDAD